MRLMRWDRQRDIDDEDFCIPIDQISPIHVPQTSLRPVIFLLLPSSLFQTMS